MGVPKKKSLVVTGASVSTMSQDIFDKIWSCDPDSIFWTINPQPNSIITLADRQKVPILEKAHLKIRIFDNEVEETFCILHDTHSSILGWSFFARNDLTIDCKRQLLIRENFTFQTQSSPTRRKVRK